jgi:3-isopropylmalate dehydrogenase
LGLFANIRPIKPKPVTRFFSLKREIIEGADFIVFRELTGVLILSEKMMLER